MRLGVCYYPEQWPEERWAIDAKLMHDLGLKIVRIGEFSWSKLEPQKGNYQWTWLDKLIQTFSSEGLDVVLATPTAKPPIWLLNVNGDIRVKTEISIEKGLKTNVNICLNNPTLIEFTFNLVSELTKRYGGNAKIIGWQIDNKFHIDRMSQCYCDHCAKNFQQWLKDKYISLDKLNQDWGTIYWGESFDDWDQIRLLKASEGYDSPSYQLELQRFRSDSIIKFLKLQVDTIKAYTTNQFVTHNFSFSNCEIDFFKLGESLDFVSWNSFPTGQAETLAKFFYGPKELVPEFVYDVGDPYITGFLHNCARGSKNSQFWVMEQQCGHIDWGSINPGIRIGAMRLWTWHAVTCGAESILFSKWRSPRYSNDQLEAGILRHDGTPANGFQEIVNMLPEAPVLVQVDEVPLLTKVAILTRYDDLWALSMETHRKDLSYLRLVFRNYRVLTSLGVSVDITTYDTNFSDYRLLIVPVLYLSDAALVSKLEAFVAQGGSVLFGPRSGFKNESNVVVEEPLPGLLLNLVGGKISNWQSIPDFVRFSIRSEISELSGEASVWIEAIIPEENESVNILARYVGGPLSGRAALTVHSFGAGNAYYLGFYPTFDQLKAIIKYLIQHEGCGNVLDLPDGVIVNQRGNNRVAFNFTRNEKTFVLDDELVTLPPRDFRFNLRD